MSRPASRLTRRAWAEVATEKVDSTDKHGYDLFPPCEFCNVNPYWGEQSMSQVSSRDLYRWCRVPLAQLASHPDGKIPLRIVKNSDAMGELMARELCDLIANHNREGRPTRAIIPCGPKCWYEPFTRIVNAEAISLRGFHVFHMDECLDWQGRLLPAKHPYNFRSFMERHFYGGIAPGLSVPVVQRHWLTPASAEPVRQLLAETVVDITVGGWGQDGHVAYNQARRNPYSRITLEELEQSGIRIQENNTDTILALAHRTFGGAYQFVPPMSITLGLRECLSAKKVRIYSDTGAWKQTALRVALFSEPTPEYPMTLLQKHPDAVLTATEETASHPISENPDWELFQESTKS
jgi:glucosamine-6-phosphate deaminase